MLNTGFDQISQERFDYNGNGFWYCEIAITNKCNFSCKYCNKFGTDKINIDNLCSFISQQKDLRHVQLTGGEPTVSPHLKTLCECVKSKNIRLGISTNGSATISLYDSLDADMFSISLDDYDCGILGQRGYKNPETIIETIKYLSTKYYVNIGVVVDKINVSRINEVIDYILSLGVSDIKLSINTHESVFPKFNDRDFSKYPILNYRVSRFRTGKNMRGMEANDNFKCELVKSDISVVGDYHYPCLVYAREKGNAIGVVSDSDTMKLERASWYSNHTPSLDPVCKKFCMDFKCEFNRSHKQPKV